MKKALLITLFVGVIGSLAAQAQGNIQGTCVQSIPGNCVSRPSPSVSPSAVNTNNGWYQLGYQFGQWLTGAGARQNAAEQALRQQQQQMMMAELARRQAEAERQHREEEARRLAAMYNRLASTLKLVGLPHLQMKSSGTVVGGLQMKLGDNTQGYGIPGLPGIYVGGPGPGSGMTPKTPSTLKLKTGDDAMGAELASNANPAGMAPGDGQQGYGIQGLPGIYTGGSSSAPAAAPPTQGGLQMKMGDGGAAPTAPPTTASDPGAVDFNQMSPKQLADVADAFSKLPPEEQQRMMAAPQNSPAASTQQAHTLPPNGGSVQPASSAPAPAPAPVMSPQTAAQPVASLQQQATASQAATTAAKPEDASMQARAGFDTPLGSLVTNPATATTSGQPISVSSQASLSAAAENRRIQAPVSTPMPPAQTHVGQPATPIATASSVIPGPSPSPNPATTSTPAPVATHPAMSMSECIAGYSPGGPVPSLDELQKKLDSTMTALERIAKSQEEAKDLNKEWTKELKDAHQDIFLNGSDMLLDGLLGVTKTSLEMYKDSYHEGLEASMKESQQLRAEYLELAGNPAERAAWQAKQADYLARSQRLLGRREVIENAIAGVEKVESVVGKIDTGRDFYLWLTDNEVFPCKFGGDGKINCDEFKKDNGISSFAQGDLNTQLDLLKQVMKFGLDYSPTIKALSHASLIGNTWKISSLVIDLTYDGTAIYHSTRRLQQAKQDDEQLAIARKVLGYRADRLQAEIGCYQKAH